jgi:hypothetical protein
VNTRIDQPMEHDIHLRCLGEYHVPWVDQSLYSPHRKSSIVYWYYNTVCCVTLRRHNFNYINYHPVISEGWHFSNTCETIPWQHHYINKGDFPIKLYQPCHILSKCLCKLAVVYKCVRGIDFASVSTILRLDFGIIPIVWHYFVFQ